MQRIAGIDIGGTSVKIAIVETGDNTRVLKQGSIPTLAGNSGPDIAKRIADATGKLIAQAGGGVVGVGVGCPGLISPSKGMAAKSPNLPSLAGFPLRDELQKHLKLPVELQNDANAAVLGEWLFGPNKGLQNIILLTLGTGVGGGVVADGKLLGGADNAAAELGHMKIQFGGAQCGCGRKGCLEAYVGSAGITRVAKEQLADNPKTILSADQLDTKSITMAAKAGDEVAKKILYIVGQYLGRGITLLIEAFNPEKILLGGGAAPAVPLLLPGINAATLEFASFAETRERAVVEQAALADEINVLGAAATYLNLHR